MSTATFSFGIDGMHCNACVRRVKAALDALPSVELTEIEVGKARGSYDPQRVELALIQQAIADAGYVPAPAADTHV